MKSTGSMWLQQVLIKCLTNKSADAATLHDSDPVVEANDVGLPNDYQPASGRLSHDPEVAANEII